MLQNKNNLLIGLPQATMPITSGHLNLGGIAPDGQNIGFTNYYMLINGKPCIPVMGEFHFSRFPHLGWEEELLKMKAGGISIVSTYVFWIHIEEDEGVFDWSGNNNLRQFVTLCGKHGLQVFVRIGPFAHGECRNGGLPDWLYGRPFEVRSNDERYLAYVRRLYNEVGQQLAGRLFKDGGPVIGIQLDNEYMHCGAPWEMTFRQGVEWVPSGSGGVEHIAILKRLALEGGLDVPVYSCTGWLNSPILEGEVLPMQGGYAFTPWSPDPNYQQAPTREFLFANRHHSPVLNGEPTYNPSRYPFACCEIGGGIQITYYHRPVVPPESVEALALVKLAGGANLLGYYMYHGGTNPIGKHNYMNEFTVPRMSYDFQAPLREFGQVADSYRYLRLLHLFLNDFGDLLAPMNVVLPDDQTSITPDNTTSLRYMVRSKDGAGFIFLNNYQDHVEMQDISDIQFQIATAEGVLTIPHTQPFTLQKQKCAIFPFGLSLGGVLLKYATTQLLTKIEGEAAIDYFFFAPDGVVSEYAFDPATFTSLVVSDAEIITTGSFTRVTVKPGTNCVLTFTTSSGVTVCIFTLTRAQAEHATKLRLGHEDRLVMSVATLVATGDALSAYSAGQTDLKLSIYPPPQGLLSASHGQLTQVSDGFFTQYMTTIPEKQVRFDLKRISADRVSLRFPPDLLDGCHDVILRIEYIGDMGCIYIGGRLIGDNFYNGACWEIGLKYLMPDLAKNEMIVAITPMDKNAGAVRHVPTGMAFQPTSEGRSIAEVRSIAALVEYRLDVGYVEAARQDKSKTAGAD